MAEAATQDMEPLAPDAFTLLLALQDVCAAVRAEPGVSMQTCSGRLHSAVGSAEHIIERLRPSSGSSGADG